MMFAGANKKALAELSAGAAQVDITPIKLPVTVNGGFLTNKVRIIADRLHSRAIVISDKKETIAIAVVDSCMIQRIYVMLSKNKCSSRPVSEKIEFL